MRHFILVVAFLFAVLHCALAAPLQPHTQLTRRMKLSHEKPKTQPFGDVNPGGEDDVQEEHDEHGNLRKIDTEHTKGDDHMGSSVLLRYPHGDLHLHSPADPDAPVKHKWVPNPHAAANEAALKKSGKEFKPHEVPKELLDQVPQVRKYSKGYK